MKQIHMLDLKLEYEYMKKESDSAIQRCLEHQQWILGPEVKDLENKIAEYIGVKHCIGVSPDTDALVLSLRALAIKLKGKEYFDKSMDYYPVPLHGMKVFEGRCKRLTSLNECETAVTEVLSLPIEPLMQKDQIEYVVDIGREFFQR